MRIGKKINFDPLAFEDKTEKQFCEIFKNGAHVNLLKKAYTDMQTAKAERLKKEKVDKKPDPEDKGKNKNG
jgi:hypothetical protein